MRLIVRTAIVLLCAAPLIGAGAETQRKPARDHDKKSSSGARLPTVDLQPGGPVPFAPSIFPPLIAPSCPGDPSADAPGVLCEDFDTERNGMPGFQWSRLPLGVSPEDPLLALGDPDDDVLGYTQDTGAIPEGTGGQECILDALFAQPTCSQPVAEENDWHLHSPTEGPGEGYDPTDTPGSGAPGGGRAHSGTRSMHMGRHFEELAGFGGPDTMRFRQVSAFVLDPPVLLGPQSTAEFWHIADMDFFNFEQSPLAGGQVHISLRGADGQFEKWQRLTPSFGPYDTHIAESIAVCVFDPGDDSFAPADESMCDAGPIWNRVGSFTGTDATCGAAGDDCGDISCVPGPGCTETGSLGDGVWTRSAFDLSPFAGRTARLRWISTVGGGWSFGASRSFLEAEVQFYEGNDPGWYIDDVVLTDLRVGEPLPPDGSGYWKHQCLSSPAEVQALFGTISDESAAFDECEAIACSVLDSNLPRWKMRPKALRELLALWLNVAAGRLPLTTSIDLPDLTEAASVAEAIDSIEAAVCDPQAKRSDLEAAKDLAEALSSGAR